MYLFDTDLSFTWINIDIYSIYIYIIWYSSFDPLFSGTFFHIRMGCVPWGREAVSSRNSSRSLVKSIAEELEGQELNQAPWDWWLVFGLVRVPGFLLWCFFLHVNLPFFEWHIIPISIHWSCMISSFSLRLLLRLLLLLLLLACIVLAVMMMMMA